MMHVIRILAFLFFVFGAIIFFPSVASVLFLAAAIIIFPFGMLREKMDRVTKTRGVRAAVCIGLFLVGCIIAPGDDAVEMPRDETASAAYEAGEKIGAASYDITHPDTKEETKSSIQAQQTPAEPEKTVFKSGHYKVGTDIPAGVYYLIEDGVMPYFNVTTDANGDDILIYSVFNGNYIVEVRDGEYFKLTSCYAVPYEDAPSVKPVNGYLSDGFYVVGTDISAGEYKLEAPEDAIMPCYSIYNDLRQDDLEDFGVIESNQYIKVKDGQYLKLTGCKLYIGE